ncbi:MAG TPA: hypothetical protein VEQ35_02475 [Beijerinckia sp.]|jgi:hypothetical protein|nr:hypothetical protein [Beijerinckia sp.]
MVTSRLEHLTALRAEHGLVPVHARGNTSFIGDDIAAEANGIVLAGLRLLLSRILAERGAREEKHRTSDKRNELRLHGGVLPSFS